MIRAFSGRARESERIVSTRTYVPPSSILTLLVLLTLGWGVNWPIMKVVMAEMPPLHFRALCLAAGAAGLFAIAQANRLPIRVPSGAWPRLIAISLGQAPEGTRIGNRLACAIAKRPAAPAARHSARKCRGGISAITTFMIGQLTPQPRVSRTSRVRIDDGGT